MNAINLEEKIKLFCVSNQLIENSLDLVERDFEIDLGRNHSKELVKDQDYYPQIDGAIRREASDMAQYYEIFYSLENSIRNLIVETLVSAEPSGWWESGRILPKIKSDAEGRMQKEIDSGVTPRSEEPIDFTNFGELGEIIKSNWDVFGGMFNSPRAVERVMANLNTLRGPIAHCSPLAEDEIVRLGLTVRDWFRLME